MYTFNFMDYPGVLADLHAVLGVDETVLPQNVAVTLPILPAAEIKVIELLPTWAEAPIDKVRLAALYYAAAFSFSIIKLNVLQIENDNKTIAQRFKDALDWANPTAFEMKAQAILNSLQTSTESVPALTISRPAIDVITGGVNA